MQTLDAVVAGAAEGLLLTALLALGTGAGVLTARGRQRRGTRWRVATRVLAAIHALNRLENVAETLRHTLDVLVTVAPDWLREMVPEHGSNATAAASTNTACPRRTPPARPSGDVARADRARPDRLQAGLPRKLHE